jgi:hypothetical protein
LIQIQALFSELKIVFLPLSRNGDLDMRIRFVIVIVLISLKLGAQKASDWGILLGASAYQGDLSALPSLMAESRPMLGLVYDYFLDKNLAVRGMVLAGGLSGDDRHRGSNFGRSWAFSAPLLEMSVQLQYHPWGKARYNQIGFFQRHLSPYVSLGLGMAYVKATLRTPPADAVLFPEPGARNVFVAMPMSGGLRYVISPQFSLFGELGARNVFSDYLDGVSDNASTMYNDWYLTGGLGLTYNIFAQY